MSATATSARRAGARTARRRVAAPRPARRVSGPITGRARVGAAARAAALPRESVALSERALAVVRGLPNHSLIDRLVRGRAWIPVLGVLLVGIVAMQVEILKLGSSMGRAVERSAVLQTQNESLRARVAGLADDQRIERVAAGMGMTMPRPESLVFLQGRPDGNLGKALASIHAPDPTGFLTQLAAQAAAAAALMPPAPAPTSAGPAAAGIPGTTGSTSAPPTVAATPTTASAAPTTASATPTTVGAAPTVASPAPAAVPSAGGTSSTSPAGAAGTGGGAGVAPVAASQSGGTPGG